MSRCVGSGIEGVTCGTGGEGVTCGSDTAFVRSSRICFCQSANVFIISLLPHKHK